MSKRQLEEMAALAADVQQNDVAVDLIPRSSAVALDDVEKHLRISLPESLKEFWETYYYVAIGGDEFTTVEQLADRMARVTTYRPSVPPNHIPILDDGSGGHYFVVGGIHGRPKPKDWGSVVFRATGEPGMKWVASDFLDFVITVIRKRL